MCSERVRYTEERAGDTLCVCVCVCVTSDLHSSPLTRGKMMKELLSLSLQLEVLRYTVIPENCVDENFRKSTKIIIIAFCRENFHRLPLGNVG